MYQELKKLVASGIVVEDVPVVNPLGVVNNASGKSRLVLHLRYVNNHLTSCKFKVSSTLKHPPRVDRR